MMEMFYILMVLHLYFDGYTGAHISEPGDLKTTPKFNNLPGEFTGHRIQSHSWLKFNTEKKQQCEIIKEQPHETKIILNQESSAESSLPVKSDRMLLPPAAKTCDRCEVLSPRETH